MRQIRNNNPAPKPRLTTNAGWRAAEALRQIVSACVLAGLPSLAGSEPLVFISAFAPSGTGAIHAFRLDVEAGSLLPVHRTAEVDNPFFMALSPDHRFLYSVHAEQFNTQKPEQVAAYRLTDRTGKLELLNHQSSHGTASCYLSVDATGRTLLLANYSSASVVTLPINVDGSLGEAASFHQHAGPVFDPVRQNGAHPHSIILSPDNRFAYVADLGLDQILSYQLDPALAKLTPGHPPHEKAPPRAGPRHLIIHPNGRHLYALNEIANSVSRYDYHPESGGITRRETISTLPPGFNGISNGADLKITPDGRFLYATNRGHDSIAAFRIDRDGVLALIGIESSRGKGPQNLAISPEGGLLLCANLPGNNVAVFRIDGLTGNLKPLGEPISMPKPSCIVLLP